MSASPRMTDKVTGDGNENRVSRLGWLGFVAFYALAANIPYWIGGRAFQFSHSGWFCLEYPGVGMLALFVSPALSAAVLVCVMLADLLCGACESYNLSTSQCLENLNQLHALSDPRRNAVVLVFFLIVLLTSMAVKVPAATARKQDRRRVILCLIVFAMVAWCVDAATMRRAAGHLPDPFRVGWVSPKRS